MSLLHITCNLSSAIRHEVMEGKEYIVVPMVMITEGVHNGTGGPLLYNAEELAKNCHVWNHKPIVVYHPQIDGVGVTACDPIILSNRKVGIVLNTKWDDTAKKLRAEAWIEKARVNEVDERIMVALENNQLVEVSTGLSALKDETPGIWNGESYTAVARDLGPDHLAILPDLVGACSIADGAGLLQLNMAALDRQSPVGVAVRNTLDSMGLLSNETSASNIRKHLYVALDARFGWDCYIEDIYHVSKFVIYKRLDKLWKLSYSLSGSEVVLSEDTPVEVTQVVEYRTLDGMFVGNSENSKEDEDVTKEVKPDPAKVKKLVDELVGNEKTHWTEDDREFLSGLDEEKLAKFQPIVVENKVVEKTKEEKEAEEKKSKETVQNQQNFEQWLANAPPQFREVAIEGHNTLVAERERLTKVIIGNERNVFTPEELSAMPTPSLRKVAAVAAAEKKTEEVNNQGQGLYNYMGQGGSWVENTGSTPSEEPLELPSMW